MLNRLIDEHLRKVHEARKHGEAPTIYDSYLTYDEVRKTRVSRFIKRSYSATSFVDGPGAQYQRIKLQNRSDISTLTASLFKVGRERPFSDLGIFCLNGENKTL